MAKIFKTIFGFLLIVIGIGLYTYPIATTKYLSYETTQYIEEYDEKWNKDSKKKADLLEEIKAYNKEIYENGQAGFCDAWSYQQAPISLKGLEDGKYGYISIPAMDVKLPLYIGASNENLTKGAAILGQTSIPIGEKNQNSVIAGHRGYHGSPYFREIEKLKKGDKVIIQTPWKKLTYYVEGYDIIDPNDIDAVKIQKGKDMVTLVTCHPYRSHGKYRYVVYCSREGKKTVSENTTTSTQPDITFTSSEPDIHRENMVRKISAIILIVGMLLTLIRIWKNRKEEYD